MPIQQSRVSPEKKSVPLMVRWNMPGKAAAAICCVAAVAAGAMILGALNDMNGSGGIKTSVLEHR